MLPVILKMRPDCARFHVAGQVLLFALSEPNRPVCVLQSRYAANLWLGEQAIDKAAVTLARPHTFLGSSRIAV